ncbi:MAG: hypothetical protein MI867_01415 [Pseudomonadales bacterium]|nr:hypothetical protein [Pseudomonadales bacterium]
MKDYREDLAQKLNVPLHEDMQDWEYEVADENRIPEYLSLYNSSGCSLENKRLLMEMIVQSLEDKMQKQGFIYRQWPEIKSLIERNYGIHKETVIYWSCIDEFTPGYYSWSVSREMKKVYWRKSANKLVNLTPGGAGH